MVVQLGGQEARSRLAASAWPMLKCICAKEVPCLEVEALRSTAFMMILCDEGLMVRSNAANKSALSGANWASSKLSPCAQEVSQHPAKSAPISHLGSSHQPPVCSCSVE